MLLLARRPTTRQAPEDATAAPRPAASNPRLLRPRRRRPLTTTPTACSPQATPRPARAPPPSGDQWPETAKRQQMSALVAIPDRDPFPQLRAHGHQGA